MTVTQKGRWNIQWSNMSLSGGENYVAMFSSKGAGGSNILFQLQEIKDLIVHKRPCSVPREVLVKALATLSRDLGQEIEEKIVA